MKSSYKQVVGNQTLPFSVATGRKLKTVQNIFLILNNPALREEKDKDTDGKVKREGKEIGKLVFN